MEMYIRSGSTQPEEKVLEFSHSQSSLPYNITIFHIVTCIFIWLGFFPRWRFGMSKVRRPRGRPGTWWRNYIRNTLVSFDIRIRGKHKCVQLWISKQIHKKLQILFMAPLILLFFIQLKGLVNNTQKYGIHFQWGAWSYNLFNIWPHFWNTFKSLNLDLHGYNMMIQHDELSQKKWKQKCLQPSSSCQRLVCKQVLHLLNEQHIDPMSLVPLLHLGLKSRPK